MNNYFLTFLIEFFFFTALFLFFCSDWAKKNLRRRKIYLTCLVLTILTQVAAAAVLRREVGDVMLFSGTGWHLRHKIDYYFIDSDHSQYPFFPVMIFIYAPINWFIETVFPGLTFSFYLKLLLLVGLYYLAFKIKDRARRLQFLTAPVTYATVVFHGQTDVLVTALLVLASSRKLVLSALSFAVSIGVKTWPALLWPVFARRLKLKPLLVFTAIIWFFLFADVFASTRYVFGSGFRVVLPAVLKAGGPPGQWGLTYFFPQFSLPFFAVLFAAGQWLLLKIKAPFYQQVFINLLFIYLILPRWGIQYLFWLWPFLFLTKLIDRLPGVKTYLLAVFSYLFLNYANVASGLTVFSSKLIWLLGLIIWFIFLFWFIVLLLPTLQARGLAAGGRPPRR